MNKSINQHTNIQPQVVYGCNDTVCDLKKTNLFDWIEHLRLSHLSKVNTLYICDICNKNFKLYVTLATHYALNHKTKWFKCDCGITFKLYEDAIAHNKDCKNTRCNKCRRIHCRCPFEYAEHERYMQPEYVTREYSDSSESETDDERTDTASWNSTNTSSESSDSD